jgi:hypothetical protein
MLKTRQPFSTIKMIDGKEQNSLHFVVFVKIAIKKSRFTPLLGRQSQISINPTGWCRQL